MIWLKQPVRHLLINAGPGIITLRPTFQNQAKTLEYFIDYDFGYEAVVPENECKPIIRFVGGACK